MHNIDVEHILSRDDAHAHNLKGKAYEVRMDRLNESAKTAKSGEDLKRLQKLRRDTLERYNKYRGTNHTS